jgi:phage N-6-adenine-methyltransferase
MNSALMFSKASDNWTTPDDFYRAIFHEFGCTVDAAATAENTKCDFWYGPGSEDGWLDALAVDWSQQADQWHWLNPPYSRVRAFMAKAAAERQHGVTTVSLVPARTDTRWWHESVWDGRTHKARTGVEVRLIKGRLRFGGASAGAPFPSALVVFHA